MNFKPFFKNGAIILSSAILAINTSCNKDSEEENDLLEDGVNTGTLTDNRDGNTYKTIKIGDQIWMAENLAYLPEVTFEDDWGNEAGAQYAVLGYEPGSGSETVEGAKSQHNYHNYGVLYNWEAAMAGDESSEENPSGVQGVCPAGWHLPSEEEWNELIEYVVAQGHSNEEFLDSNGAGNALKSCWQVDSPLSDDCARNEHPRWDAHNVNVGLDKFGFAGLPGGLRIGGDFGGLGIDGTWWSATESTEWSSGVATFNLGRNGGIASSPYVLDAKSGLSIRCIKD